MKKFIYLAPALVAMCLTGCGNGGSSETIVSSSSTSISTSETSKESSSAESNSSAESKSSAEPISSQEDPSSSCSRSSKGPNPYPEWWTTTGTIEKDSKGQIIFDDIVINLTHVVCGHDEAGYVDLIKRFNSEYNGKIKIEQTALDQLSIDQNVSQRIINKDNPPDLVMQHQKSHENFEVNKLIQPIDECFDYAEIPLSKDTFIPGFAAYCDLNYGDKSRVFDYPVDGQSVVGYYRKDLLDQLGLPVPTTRKEMIAAAKKAQSQLGMANPIGITGNSEFYQFYVSTTALAQNGFQFYDESDGYHVHWTTEQNKQAFVNGVHSITDLTKVEHVYQKVNDETSGLNNFCNNDEYLFFFDLPFDANTIFDTFESSHKGVKARDVIKGFSAAKMFALDENKDYASAIYGDSHAFMVSKSVTDMTKKAAIAVFVNWFTSQGSIGAEWAELGHAAGTNVIVNSKEYKESAFVNDYTYKWYDDMSTFETPGKTPYYTITYADGIYGTFSKGMAASSDANMIKQLTSAEKSVNGRIDLL